MENNFGKTADRAAYEMEPAVRKTVRDYAEEINAVLENSLETVEELELFVGGYERSHEEKCVESSSLVDRLELALCKAKYLRGQLWQLSKLMQ